MTDSVNPDLSAASRTNFSFGSFIKTYGGRVALLVVAILCALTGFVTGLPIGLYRGLTRYRPLIAGRSLSALAADERYNYQLQRQRAAYSGAIAVPPMPGTAAMNWVLGRTIRLFIVAFLWPALEIFFQLRFLIPAFRDARRNGLPS